VSPTRLLQLCGVVWAELEDANGYRKVRPVVVVTPTAELAAGKPVRVVSSYHDPTPQSPARRPRVAALGPAREGTLGLEASVCGCRKLAGENCSRRCN